MLPEVFFWVVARSLLLVATFMTRRATAHGSERLIEVRHNRAHLHVVGSATEAAHRPNLVTAKHRIRTCGTEAEVLFWFVGCCGKCESHTRGGITARTSVGHSSVLPGEFLLGGRVQSRSGWWCFAAHSLQISLF